MPLKILSLLSFTISFAGICLIFGLSPASVKKDLEKLLEPDGSLRGRVLASRGDAGSPFKKRIAAALQKTLAAYGKDDPGIGGTIFVATVAAFAGCCAGAVFSAWFLIPLSLACGVFIPVFVSWGAVTAFDRKMNEELETALSVITSAYMRTGNTVDAVSASLPNIKPPVREIFRRFTVNATLVSADVRSCIREMRDSTGNESFREWCEVLIACQDDSSNRSSLIPAVDKMAETRLVNSELETMIISCRRDYLGMVVITVCNVPLLYLINREWFNALVGTPAGQTALAVCGCVIIATAFVMMKLTRPLGDDDLRKRR